MTAAKPSLRSKKRVKKKRENEVGRDYELLSTSSTLPFTTLIPSNKK